MDDFEVLRKVPIFQSLSDVQLAQLAHLTMLRLCHKDEVVFHEDEPGDHFFVILKGQVKITLLGIPDRFTRGNGREVVLSQLGPGDFFGEMALVDDEPRSATAVAAEDAELLCLHRNDFRAVLSDWRGVVYALLRSLTARLRRANHHLATLSIMDGHGRVARAILDLARETGQRGEDGRVTLKKISRTRLAEDVGTSRDTVARTIAELQEQRLIEVVHDHLVVLPEFERAFD